MLIDGAIKGVSRKPAITARNKILPLAATVVALTLQAPTAASVNTQEWKNIAGAVVASVDKDGVFAGTWQGASITTTYTDAKVKTVTGTLNRLTVGGTATDPTFDISTSYAGQNTITTLGTIGTGVWQGTAIADAYISSAATWNAKEPAIAAGTTAQYWRGDKSWQTLDKSAVGLGNVENTALSTWVGSANITTLGTVGTGTWNATAIADGKIASALTGKTYNALTLTAFATGFTIAGGTTSKTLTVPLDASVSGTNTGDQTTVSGNAGTATALQTARNINGTSFNGTADITITAAAGTLTGATLAAGVTASSLTSVGTLAALTVTATIAGSVNGNAATATALQNARTINGTSFDGTGNITVTAAAGTLTGTTLNSTVVTSSLTAIGTLAAGLTVGGNAAAATNITINVAGTTTSRLVYQTAGSDRWHFRKDAAGEAGANAGSNFRIDSYDDTGTIIDNVLLITRAAGGAFAVSRPITTASTTDSTTTATGALIVSGGIGVAKRITLDGASGKTLRITNSVANAAVAVTLGAGPTGSTAGNPQGWMRIDIAGTDRYIPFW